MGDRQRATSPAGVWLALALVSLIVAGLAGIAMLTYSRATAPLSSGSSGSSAGDLLTPLRISTATAGIYCPTDPAISPDGMRLVVIGVLGACDPATGLPQGAAPHVAAIFDTQSGELSSMIRLEPVVERLLRVSPREQPATVRFFGLGWSPDAAHIALVFAAFDSASSLVGDNLLGSGLLVLSAAGSAPTIIIGDSGYSPTVGDAAAGFPIWDLPHQSEVPDHAIAPGLAYSWSPAGLPTPLEPLQGPLSQLPINAGPRYPVGTPDGGASFTIWQPGIVVGAAQAAPLGGGRAVFLTVFPTWSPDGTYLTMLSAGVALTPPSGVAPASSGMAVGGPLPLPTPATVAQAPGRDWPSMPSSGRLAAMALPSWHGILLVTCWQASTASRGRPMRRWWCAVRSVERS